MAPQKNAPDSRLAKLVKLGLGAFWMTEQSVRNAVSDLRLPRDAARFLIEQLDRRKQEVLAIVRAEIRRAMKRVDVAALARELIAGHDLEVTATVRFNRRR